MIGTLELEKKLQTFQNVKEDLEKIPKTSGLYYFYDKDNKIMYIGKAKNLHLRTFLHRGCYLFHREGMFFRKILISKELLLVDEEDWPKELWHSWRRFQIKSLSEIRPRVIDYIFQKVKKIEIEEMPHELTKSKEAEMIKKLKPPFNHETASEEYYRLLEDFE